MEYNITGFNPSRAESNIRQFASEVEAAYRSLQTAIGDFTFSLAENWASPEAVKFKSEVKPLFDELFRDMNDTSLSIQRGAIEAYNAAARANGAHGLADFAEGFFDATDFADLYENLNGVVGMDIEKVKASILPKFIKDMSNCENQIDAITTSIALYDAEGGQQRAYSTGISRFKNTVISVVDTTTRIVENALDTETNAVFQSAQNAASVLSVASRE